MSPSNAAQVATSFGSFLLLFCDDNYLLLKLTKPLEVETVLTF